MRYLAAFVASAILTSPLLLAAAFLLAPAPIAAEYWVRQLMVVKRDLALRHQGERKGLVVGGSSALFAIDTGMLTERFGVPFLNLATHVRLPLALQLAEADAVAERGDVVILALEPACYLPSQGDLWFARNAIAWKPEAWRALPAAERALVFWHAGPRFLAELAIAHATQTLAPAAIAHRIEAMDDPATLREFAAAAPPREFGYSVANIDSLGNIQRIEGVRHQGVEGHAADIDIAVHPDARAELRAFAQRSRIRGVEVRFANAPFVAAPGLDPARVRRAEHAFERELESIAPMLGSRADSTFEPPYFFDTALHLNAEGRRRRTEALAMAIERDPALMARLRGSR